MTNATSPAQNQPKLKQYAF